MTAKEMFEEDNIHAASFEVEIMSPLKTKVVMSLGDVDFVGIWELGKPILSEYKVLSFGTTRDMNKMEIQKMKSEIADNNIETDPDTNLVCKVALEPVLDWAVKCLGGVATYVAKSPGNQDVIDQMNSLFDKLPKVAQISICLASFLENDSSIDLLSQIVDKGIDNVENPEFDFKECLITPSTLYIPHKDGVIFKWVDSTICSDLEQPELLETYKICEFSKKLQEYVLSGKNPENASLWNVEIEEVVYNVTVEGLIVNTPAPVVVPAPVAPAPVAPDSELLKAQQLVADLSAQLEKAKADLAKLETPVEIPVEAKVEEVDYLQKVYCKGDSNKEILLPNAVESFLRYKEGNKISLPGLMTLAAIHGLESYGSTNEGLENVLSQKALSFEEFKQWAKDHMASLKELSTKF